MKHHLFLFGLLSLVLACNQTEAPIKIETLQKAQMTHLETLTLVTHNAFDLSNFADGMNYTQDTDTQINIPKMQRGGLDVVWFVVSADHGATDDSGDKKSTEHTQAQFDAIHRLAETYARNKIGLATSVEAVDQIRKTGRKVAMIGVENGYALGIDTANVKKFYDQGARYLSLAHNGDNQLIDSEIGDEDRTALNTSLSSLDKLVIENMNYYGMMVDISNSSKAISRQAILHSKAPVIASHAAVRALCDHSGNLDDKQLEWIKTNGGVIQTVASPIYLNKEKHLANQEAREKVLTKNAAAMDVKLLSEKERQALTGEQKIIYDAQYKALLNRAAEDLKIVNSKFPPVAVSDFVDHIDYIKNKIGIDHVGISADFDGGGGIEGWSDASESFNITLELVRRGYSKEAIGKIWSGNLLRVLESVENTAAELQNK